MSLLVMSGGGDTVNVIGSFTASSTSHELTFDREPKGIIIQDAAYRTGLTLCVGWWVNGSSTGWKQSNTGGFTSMTVAKSDDGKSITIAGLSSGRTYSYIAFF